MPVVKRVFFAVLFAFLLLSLFKNLSSYQRNQSFYKGYVENLEKARQTNVRLKTEKLRKTSLREVEKTIRNKLNLLRPNEIAVIIPPPSPTPTPIITPELPVYEQWYNVFFKVD